MADFQEPDNLTDEQILDLDRTMEDIVNRRIKQEHEKKTLADDTKAAAERFGFKPTQFNTMVTERHKESVSRKAQDQMVIVDFAENIRDRARAIKKARGNT